MTKKEFCLNYRISIDTLRRRVIGLYKHNVQRAYNLPLKYSDYKNQKLLTTSQIEGLKAIF